MKIIRENRTCPSEYRDFLIRIGGTNPYGDAMFRLVWGGSHTKTIYGQMFGGSKGQHIRLKYHGIPAWHLEMWMPPESFGTPEKWYSETWDAETGYHTLGDYPFRGDYECVAKLYTREFINGEVVIDALPLNFRILEILTPEILRARGMSYAERLVAIRAEKEAEEKNAERIAKDAYMDATPAFGGVAGTYTSNREKLLERLQFRISAEEIKRQMGTGHRQFQIRNQEMICQ